MLSTWLGNEVTTRVGISNLDVMVSMDSGNAHIAMLVKLSHWGATHPYAGFSPFHQPLENTLVSEGTISHATHSVYG
jgi:hypothetical protein